MADRSELLVLIKKLTIICACVLFFSSAVGAGSQINQFAILAVSTTVPGKVADYKGGNAAKHSGELKKSEGSYTSYISIFSSIPFFPDLLWLFSFGDASINTIAKKNNIKQIHHIDERTDSFWFVFKWVEEKNITVYGY
jgi:hypothetical protein